MTPIALSRRNLLRAGGCLLVALTVPRVALAQDTARVLAKDQLDGFLAIDRSGVVTLYSGKVDLGTGARAAYRQIVAEELDLDPTTIKLVEGDTAMTPDQGTTAGSNGIAVSGMEFRRAAATARAKLLALAAARLNIPVTDLTLSHGTISTAAGARVGFGDLIGDQKFDMKIDNAAPLKSPADYRIVGKPFARPDLADKFTGRAGGVTEEARKVMAFPSWLPSLLGFLTAVVAFSTDMYLPAFPAIEASLGAPAGSAQMTLATWFAGLAVGQITQGTLADRFGRRVPLLCGFALYTAGCVGCASDPAADLGGGQFRPDHAERGGRRAVRTAGRAVHGWLAARHGGLAAGRGDWRSGCGSVAAQSMMRWKEQPS